MSVAQEIAIFIIPYVVNFDFASKAVSYVYMISYAILTISYTLIIIYLCMTLRRMSNFGDFSEQHRDILLQFLIFLFAFFAKLSLQAAFLIGAKHDWEDYAYYMMQICSHILVDVMPVTYMLYCHHKTYKITPEEAVS